MPYVTTYQKGGYQQVSFEDLVCGSVDTTEPLKYKPIKMASTHTRYVSHIDDEMLCKANIPSLIRVISDFNDKCGYLLENDMSKHYHTFFIPKRNGGQRRIDAPNPELMYALRCLKGIFEENFHVLYHTNVYSYVKNRSCVDAVKCHQKNESRWFLKLDFHDFFGSTTKEFIMKQLSVIFPFSEVMKVPNGYQNLDRALSLCFLNGKLPQGTPISPMLTNIMMIPIDLEISRALSKESQKYVYTRYADDICISSKYTFNHQYISDLIVSILNKWGAPFSLNSEKTKYGSFSGSNWILGVMLNRNNDITIGYKNKREFRATIFNYIKDSQAGISYSVDEVYAILGKLSYYMSVEKDWVTNIINAYNKKFSFDVVQHMKDVISK